MQLLTKMIREESSRRRRSAAEPEPEPRWRRSAEEEESETPALSAATLGKRNYQALLDLKVFMKRITLDTVSLTLDV